MPIARLLAPLFVLLTLSANGVFAEMPENVFVKLHKDLRPDPAEIWRTVPWKIAVIDAQQTAAEQNKPIFIWAMDGHPLGCT